MDPLKLDDNERKPIEKLIDEKGLDPRYLIGFTINFGCDC